MGRLNQALLSVKHQTGNRGSICTIATAFVKGPREGVQTDCPGTHKDVRILCKAAQLNEALRILNRPHIQVDSKTYVRLLQDCIGTKDLAKGKQVHAHILQSGLKPSIFLLNTLVNMYAKCGSMLDARGVFDEMTAPDMFTWTMMMSGYAKHGHAKEAFKMYEQMKHKGVSPDKVTFICVLNVCASLTALEKGKEVHADIIKAGIASFVNLENSLVDMYAKCGSINDARRVFDNMANRDVVSWSTMIAAYAQHGCGREAFKIYEQMHCEGVRPNWVTLISVLDACCSLGALEKGKEVHADIVKAGIASHTNLETALIDMYSKCGSMKDARQVFDNMSKRDVVSWNAMIAGYNKCRCGKEAFEIYEEMQREKFMPDRVTFICALNSCAGLGVLEMGRKVHADIKKAGHESCFKLETALIDMYFKIGSFKDAQKVFEKMANCDVVSWSVMIAGYAQLGYGREALHIYEQMQLERVTPDTVTFTSLLNVCASLGVLEKGKEVHADIIKAGIASEVIFETALVEMYLKCGSMLDACHVFYNMAERNVVSWSVMITGCAQHGHGREALQLFEQMQQEGLKPNGVTFISLLSACSHMGLVEEGHHYFDSMSAVHGLTPTMEHCGCMVDLLGRAGQLDEAEDFINKMPLEPDSSVWGALLGACRIHGNVDVAERAAKCILKLDPQHPAASMLLSNNWL